MSNEIKMLIYMRILLYSKDLAAGGPWHSIEQYCVDKMYELTQVKNG